MDLLLGDLIDDNYLFRIIQSIIIILILVTVYVAIQITLTWKSLEKGTSKSDEIISNKGSFYRITFFIFIAGFFMLLHEFLEGSADDTTYEFFELLALLGLLLFMIEWHIILKNLKRKQKTKIGQFTSNSIQSNK